MTTSRQSSQHPSYVARTPLDLVALAPITLGFHPEDSLVLMTFGGGGAASFHARVDLPPAAEDQDEVAQVLARAVARYRIPQAVIVLYTADASLAAAQCRCLVGRLLDEDCDVIEALRVDGGRYFVLPEDGSPGTPYDLSGHAFTAEHVLSGRVVERDRASLAAGLLPELDEAGRADQVEVTLAATRVAQALVAAGEPGSAGLERRWREESAWMRQRLRRQTRRGGPVGAGDAGRLLVLASQDVTRDLARALMSRDSPQHVLLWRELLRRAPRDLRPGAGSLLAFAAWLRGDGALAWCALDLAQQIEPDHPLAAEVSRLLGGAESPYDWVPD